MLYMPTFKPATSTMVSRIHLWSYDQVIRQALEDFAEGNHELQPLANTIDSFFNTAVALEEKKDCNKYNESYGIRMMWNFVSHVIPTLTNDESSIGCIAETLKENIRFLDEALRSKYSKTDDDATDIERELRKLKSETVLLAIVKFLHNKSQSRILYNRYKECLSKFQKESIKCVLQGLLDSKKVLKPYAEYLKLVQDTVHKILSVADITMISKLAQNCSKLSWYAKWFDDVDSSDTGHASSESEVEAEKSSSQERTLIRNVERAHPKTRSSVKSSDSVEVVEVSSTSKARQPPFPPPATKTNTFQRVRTPTNLSVTNRSLVDSGKFKLPRRKPPPRPPASYAGGKIGKSITASSKMSYSTRQRHAFTPLQDAYIIMGMKKFGSDKREWKKMLDYYPFPEYRTGMHLKDRWRTLLNQGEVKVVYGEIKLSDKYTLLIKYLNTKNTSQNHKKDKTKSKVQMQKSSSNEHSLQQTPDSTYLSPFDLSDSDDRESPIPVPLENVKRWIKTGKTMTEKTPPPRIPPLLITKTREERRKRNMSGISSNLPPSPEIVTTSTNGENIAMDQKPNLKNYDQNSTPDSPVTLPDVITVTKKCEYEKNSNGKYMRKQKNILNEPHPQQVVLEQREQADSNKFHKVAENQHSDQISSGNPDQELTEKESAEQTAAPVVLESDDCNHKRLPPPEDNEEDMDLISAMEEEEEEGLFRAEEDYNQSQQGYSQSTIGLLERISSKIESQTQIPSQTEKSDTHVTQRNSEIILNTRDAKAHSEEQEYQQSTLDILVAATESQDLVSISQKNSEEAESQVQTSAQDGKQDTTSSQSSSETTVDLQSVSQPTMELLNNPKNEDIASETSVELSADGDGSVLNLELSLASSSSILQTPCISDAVSHGDDSDASVVLYIDEDWSADDNDETLVEEKSVTTPRPSDPEQSSDGGYITAVVERSEKAKYCSRLRSYPPIATVKDQVDLNTQKLEAIIETPAHSPAGSSILNPHSPMSEYYTASEASFSKKDKQVLQQSDAEASDTNNETVIQNITVKDADIPNNIEQWMAENPPLTNSEQPDTLDLLTNLEKKSQYKVSLILETSQDPSTVKNAADALHVENQLVNDYNYSVKSFENPTDFTIPDSPCNTESANAIFAEANEPSTSPAPIFLSNNIKKECKDFTDTLVPPPNEMNVKYFNGFSTEKEPILRLNRIKTEPGVFSTDLCMWISSDSSDVEGINTSGNSHGRKSKTKGIDVPLVGTAHAMASSSVSENSTIHDEASALDLSVRHTKYLAKKSTGGVRKNSKVKIDSAIDVTKNGRAATASCNKKTANDSKARKNKESKVGSGGDATTTRKKSSKRDGHGTDTMDSSDSKLNHKKRKLLMHNDGVPLKLTRDDDLLFNSGAKVKNAKAFDTFGRQTRGRRKAWSQDEDDNLQEGVQKYGEGRWKQILDHYQFRNRTVVNLKDRYRILKEN